MRAYEDPLATARGLWYTLGVRCSSEGFDWYSLFRSRSQGLFMPLDGNGTAYGVSSGRKEVISGSNRKEVGCVLVSGE